MIRLLRWLRDWGRHEEFLEGRRARGLPVPALDRRPDLEDDDLVVWRAFAELSEARRRTTGLEPLAMSDIAAHLDIYDVADPDERVSIMRAVMRLDAEFLSDADPSSSD
jgi:hypothetical protein